MRMESIVANLVVSLLGSRGNQVNRKDKDLMSDTGGTSKLREREPEQKPPREDMKKPYRTKDRPSEERDRDTDKDSDKKSDPDVRAARIVEKMAGNQAMKAKMELSRYPSTLKAFLQKAM